MAFPGSAAAPRLPGPDLGPDPVRGRGFARPRPTNRRTRSESDSPTARALVCHSARSASLARIFTQTSRAAPMISFPCLPDGGRRGLVPLASPCRGSRACVAPKGSLAASSLRPEYALLMLWYIILSNEIQIPYWSVSLPTSTTPSPACAPNGTSTPVPGFALPSKTPWRAKACSSTQPQLQPSPAPPPVLEAPLPGWRPHRLDNGDWGSIYSGNPSRCPPISLAHASRCS